MAIPFSSCAGVTRASRAAADPRVKPAGDGRWEVLS
jgi:hypothetical protein